MTHDILRGFAASTRREKAKPPRIRHALTKSYVLHQEVAGYLHQCLYWTYFITTFEISL